MTRRWAARQEIDLVLKTLAGIERQCLPHLPRGTRRLARIGSTLVQRRYLTSRLLPEKLGLARPGPLPPPLRRLHSGRVLLAALIGARYSAASAAEAIRLDRNVRGFYLADAATIKLRAATQHDALSREVRARHDVERSGTVRVPRLIAYELTADQPFLCEALIAGRRPQGAADDGRILSEVLPAFCRMYRALSMDEMRVASFFDLAQIRKESLACLQMLPADTPRHARAARWLESVERLADAVLPASTCHGDLSHGNMIIDGSGDLWVVDWETSRAGPILWDWRKLGGAISGCGELYARLVMELYPHGLPQAMPALREQERLVKAALLAEVAVLLRARAASTSYARRRIAAAVSGLVGAFDEA